VPRLLARFDRAGADPARRHAVGEALAYMGPQAAAAISRLIAWLRDPKAASRIDVRTPLRALAAIGPAAGSAKATVLALLEDRDGPFALEALKTLAAIGARLDAREWQRLYGRYTKSWCQDADSIPMFNLTRDERCAEEAGALERLGKLGGHRFKVVEWRH